MTSTHEPGGVLQVTDSRTGRSYDLPITDGAIRAADLRQIKVSDDDIEYSTTSGTEAAPNVDTAVARDGDRRGLSDRRQRQSPSPMSTARTTIKCR